MQFPKRIVVASVPYKKIFEFPSEHGQAPGGIEGLLIEILANILKFEYSLVEPKDGEWGTFRNGSWTGILGMVGRGEADIGAACLSISYEPHEVVDFSVPYMSMDQTFATFQPRLLSRSYAYVYPFDKLTWSLIGVLLVGISFLLYLSERGRNSYASSMLEVFANFLGKSILKPRERRAFVVSWWLLSIVISHCYTSILPSFLFTPLREQPVTTFKELSEAVSSGEYKTYAWKGTNQIPEMLLSKSNYVSNIGKVIVRRQWFVESLDCISIHCYRPKTAFLDGRSYLELEYGMPPTSDMLISSDGHFNSYISLAIDKRFCCKKLIDRTLRRIFETGIFERNFMLTIYKSNIEVYKDPGARSIQMKIGDLKGPIFVLLIGYGISTFILFLELFYKVFSFKKNYEGIRNYKG